MPTTDYNTSTSNGLVLEFSCAQLLAIIRHSLRASNEATANFTEHLMICLPEDLVLQWWQEYDTSAPVK